MRGDVEQTLCKGRRRTHCEGRDTNTLRWARHTLVRRLPTHTLARRRTHTASCDVRHTVSVVRRPTHSLPVEASRTISSFPDDLQTHSYTRPSTYPLYASTSSPIFLFSPFDLSCFRSRYSFQFISIRFRLPFFRRLSATFKPRPLPVFQWRPCPSILPTLSFSLPLSCYAIPPLSTSSTLLSPLHPRTCVLFRFCFQSIPSSMCLNSISQSFFPFMTYTLRKIKNRWFCGVFYGHIVSKGYFHCYEPSCPFSVKVTYAAVDGKKTPSSIEKVVFGQHCHVHLNNEKVETRKEIERERSLIAAGLDEGGRLASKHLKWQQDAKKRGWS